MSDYETITLQFSHQLYLCCDNFNGIFQNPSTNNMETLYQIFWMLFDRSDTSLQNGLPDILSLKSLNKFLQCNVHLRNLKSLSWWHHQMETFSALLVICAGNSPVPVNSPHKGQWRGALMFSLICIWINGWVNSREAGDLRCYRTHYDVTVMMVHCSPS